ncbi:MAG: efflux RND transporter permease subunit [Pseudomonadota bacterium]|nr:efflux RND transporter permease subunit [Pseudomonadota bacterium]
MHGDARGAFSQMFIRVTEPIVFGKRSRTLTVLFFMTLLMGWQASQLKLDTGFEKQLPLQHPYMQVFKKYQAQFGGANTVLFGLVLKEDAPQKDIYNGEFLQALKDLTEAVAFTPGMDRTRVSSLFTPDVRYVEVREEGLYGGNVIPAEYSPSPEMLEQVRSNVTKAKITGRLVANDSRGAMVFSELLELNPVTGEKLDYVKTAHLIEDVRRRFTEPKMFEYKLKADSPPFKAGDVAALGYTDQRGFMFRFRTIDATYKLPNGEREVHALKGSDLTVEEVDNPDYNPDIGVHIVGFAKVVGDIADASLEVVGFFALTIFLTWVILWWYTGSPLIALIPLSCGILAVVWELGILHMAGYGLDPFAILVPFLVMAISVSHGIQITSFWLYEVAEHGHNSLDASRATYRRLVIPGITALLTNVVGFGTILLIPVGIVQEMAINAMFGLIAVIVCKKILLPCLLSYAKLNDPIKFRDHQRRRDAAFEPVWHWLSGITAKPVAAVVLGVAILTWGWAEYVSKDLAIGELHDGVPELRPDSRYNKDSARIVSEFSIGVDLIKVVAENPADGCIDHEVMEEIDRFAWRMQNTPGVQSTLSMPQVAKIVFNAFSEGSPKWLTLPREPGALVLAGQRFPTSTGFLNNDCSAMPVFIFTADHKAETIDGIIAAVEKYISEQGPEPLVNFRLATGNVGVMAAANDVIEDTEPTVLFWLFLFIGICVWASFRSLAGLICVLVPLALVSVFTYAVMVFLGIGLKISTLPVAAFAAGIGVDYGIYIYSVFEECVKEKKMTLRAAYAQTLHQTGKAVIVTGLALAASVCTWLLSGLQFQVDMGILLTIMFLANAVAAVILLPAFAAFLLKPDADATSDRPSAGAAA